MIRKSSPDIGKVGMLATLENTKLESHVVENAEGIAFGLAVAQGTNDRGVRPVKSGDTKFIGIVASDDSSRADDRFVQYEEARVLINGSIWVQVTEDVKADDDVAVDLTTGKFNKSGAKYPNARYRTSAVSGSLAQVQLR